MTRYMLYNAINRTAVRLELNFFIPVNKDVMVPGAMVEVAAAAWARNLPDDSDTKLIREQLKFFLASGKLKVE